MEITEVRIFVRGSEDKKLRAFATVTFDNSFVVRNIKIIEGNKGLFVAMPSRKIKEPCPRCGVKNAVRSKYCNQCGTNLPSSLQRPVIVEEQNMRQSEHRDIAHPITSECREMIQRRILEAYEAERRRRPSIRSTATPEPAREVIEDDDIE